MKDFRHEIAAEYQDLFNFMKQEHDLILTIDQMDEIIYAVRRFEDSYDDKLGKEISEMSDDVEGQSEGSSMPHEFTERDNFSGRCLICGKGKLFH